jgi:hypothetical protein
VPLQAVQAALQKIGDYRASLTPDASSTRPSP